MAFVAAVCAAIVAIEWRKHAFLTVVSYLLIIRLVIPVVVVGAVAADYAQTALAKFAYGIDQHLGSAVQLAAWGTLFILIGYVLQWSIRWRSRNVKALIRISRRFGSVYIHPFGVIVLCIFGSVLIAYVVAQGGSMLNLRYFANNEPTVRPFIRLVFSVAPFAVCGAFALAVIEQHVGRKIFFAMCGLLLIGVTISSGSRMTALEGPLFFLLGYIGIYRRRLPLRVVLVLPIFLIALAVLKAIRALAVDGSAELAKVTVAFDELIFGSTFSDLRALAALLSQWDGDFFGVKPYLAGLLGFIPSGMWEFRQQWLFGNIGPEMLGLDPAIHPGVRPVLTTELYFSFGYAGTAISGLVVGAGLGFLSRLVGTLHAYDIKDAFRIYVGLWFFYTLILTVVLPGSWPEIYAMIAVTVLLFWGKAFAHTVSNAVRRRSAQCTRT